MQPFDREFWFGNSLLGLFFGLTIVGVPILVIVKALELDRSLHPMLSPSLIGITVAAVRRGIYLWLQ